MLDPSIFSRYKTKQDFDLEREEFETRKRQQQLQEQLGGLQVKQAEKQLNAPEDTDQLLAKAIQLGGVQNLTPQEQAQLRAFDISQRTKQSVDARGNVITNQSIFDMLPGQINSMPPSQVMNASMGSTTVPNTPATSTPILPQGINVGGDPMLANQQAAAAQAAQLGMPDMPNAVNPSQYGITSPYVLEDLRKEQALLDMKQQADVGKELQKSDRAYQSFLTAIGNIETTMADTTTNPVFGKVPAVTADAQIAEGSIAIMLPVLKQLFRESGEGVFTDKDQEILMGMLPTRSDYGPARAAKLQMVKDTVAAKLGKTQSKPISSSGIDNLLNKYAPVN